MSTEKEYNRNGFLADLLAQAKEGEGLDVVRLRDEIKKEIGTEDKIFGKFLVLVESLRDVIPEEKQRFSVAIKALSTTSGISRQNVLEAANSQLEELRLIEQGILSGFPRFRDELKAMESRSKEIRNEIAELREKIVQFEKEGQEILGRMAAREREMKVVEDAVSKLFTNFGAEITDIMKKIEDFTGEQVPSQPAISPDSIEETRSKEESEVPGEEENNKEGTPVTQETEWVKKCPMCAGQFHFHLKELKWICYTCGHEELTKDVAEGEGENTTASEPVPPSEAAPVAGPAPVTRPVPAMEPAPEQKLIPVADAPIAGPAASSPPVKKQLPGKKKPCPVCRKQMNWIEYEKSWQCPSCGYHRRVF